MRKNIRTKLAFAILVAIAMFLLIFIAQGNSIPKGSAVIIGVNKDRPNIITDIIEKYAVAPDGSGRVSFPLVKKLEEPRWSPDRRWIIFSTRFSQAFGGGNPEIYLMPYDGEYTLQLTDNAGENDSAPSWSPDGKRIIYYSSANPKGGRGIYLLDLACLLERQDCEPQPQFVVKGENAKWSPTSNEILVESKNKFFVYDLTTKKQRDLGVEGWDAVWSPDGKQIAYQDSSQEKIITMDKDGSNAYAPIPEDKSARLPSWSPDGRYLLFTSKREGYGKPFTFVWGGEDLYTRGVFSLELITGKITQLSAYKNEEAIWYAWYPGEPNDLAK
jgi:Tol biopolymer transport system component